MIKSLPAFGAAAVVFIAILACSATGSSQTSTLTVADLARYSSDILDVYGPAVQAPYEWQTRHAVFDMFDAVMQVPPNPYAHPFLDPVYGEWIARFHERRLDVLLDGLANDPPPTTGIRLHKGYSSGWIIQGPNTAIAVDVSNGFFQYNVSGQPGSRPGQWATLADNIDAYFISHYHADHVCPQLVVEMIARGKPVYVPADIFAVVAAVASPLLAGIQIPPYDTPVTIGDLTFIAFNGCQCGQFMDPPFNTIPLPGAPLALNNAFLFEMNGQTAAHFGDNNDLDILPWLAARASQGWNIDYHLNLGAAHPAVVATYAIPWRFLSHELEFTHPYGVFIPLNQTTNFNPNKIVLAWGECIDVDL